MISDFGNTDTCHQYIPNDMYKAILIWKHNGNRLSINDFVRIKLPEYFHISLIFSIFMVENSLVWLMVSLKFEYMFELLLIIYLVPVIIILSLLWRLVLWLVRNVLRLAGWLLKKVCVLVWKGLLLLVGIFLGRCCVNRPPDSR